MPHEVTPQDIENTLKDLLVPYTAYIQRQLQQQRGENSNWQAGLGLNVPVIRLCGSPLPSSDSYQLSIMLFTIKDLISNYLDYLNVKDAGSVSSFINMFEQVFIDYLSCRSKHPALFEKMMVQYIKFRNIKDIQSLSEKIKVFKEILETIDKIKYFYVDSLQNQKHRSMRTDKEDARVLDLVERNITRLDEMKESNAGIYNSVCEILFKTLESYYEKRNPFEDNETKFYKLKPREMTYERKTVESDIAEFKKTKIEFYKKTLLPLWRRMLLSYVLQINISTEKTFYLDRIIPMICDKLISVEIHTEEVRKVKEAIEKFKNNSITRSELLLILWAESEKNEMDISLIFGVAAFTKFENILGKYLLEDDYSYVKKYINELFMYFKFRNEVRDFKFDIKSLPKKLERFLNDSKEMSFNFLSAPIEDLLKDVDLLVTTLLGLYYVQKMMPDDSDIQSLFSEEDLRKSVDLCLEILLFLSAKSDKPLPKEIKIKFSDHAYQDFFNDINIAVFSSGIEDKKKAKQMIKTFESEKNTLAIFFKNVIYPSLPRHFFEILFEALTHFLNHLGQFETILDNCLNEAIETPVTVKPEESPPVPKQSRQSSQPRGKPKVERSPFGPNQDYSQPSQVFLIARGTTVVPPLSFARIEELTPARVSSVPSTAPAAANAGSSMNAKNALKTSPASVTVKTSAATPVASAVLPQAKPHKSKPTSVTMKANVSATQSSSAFPTKSVWGENTAALFKVTKSASTANGAATKASSPAESSLPNHDAKQEPTKPPVANPKPSVASADSKQLHSSSQRTGRSRKAELSEKQLNASPEPAPPVKPSAEVMNLEKPLENESLSSLRKPAFIPAIEPQNKLKVSPVPVEPVVQEVTQVFTTQETQKQQLKNEPIQIVDLQAASVSDKSGKQEPAKTQMSGAAQVKAQPAAPASATLSAAARAFVPTAQLMHVPYIVLQPQPQVLYGVPNTPPKNTHPAPPHFGPPTPYSPQNGFVPPQQYPAMVSSAHLIMQAPQQVYYGVNGDFGIYPQMMHGYQTTSQFYPDGPNPQMPFYPGALNPPMPFYPGPNPPMPFYPGPNPSMPFYPGPIPPMQFYPGPQ